MTSGAGIVNISFNDGNYKHNWPCNCSCGSFKADLMLNSYVLINQKQKKKEKEKNICDVYNDEYLKTVLCLHAFKGKN